MPFFKSKASKPVEDQEPKITSKENKLAKGNSISPEESRSSVSSIERACRMKVLVRIRPLNKIEKQSRANASSTIQANNDEKTLQIYNTDGKISVMSFNRVCDDSTDQQAFFEHCGVTDIIDQALKGYSTTVFAFGQTGSGKTFTITGPSDSIPSPETVGIVPRALDFMFNEVNRKKQTNEISNIRIQASYMEIYNENVLDLLNPQNSGLPVRWSPERGFFVEHLFIVDCDSLDDCLAVLEEGMRNRTTAAHEMNEHSSRSHSILTIYLEVQRGDDESEHGQHRYGKISFVDLAGSEKVKESRTTLDTFAEALSINKSLLTLGKCISLLADPKTRGGHIPFRDSKLTKLLADSLSGKGLALMVACISPAFQNLNETLKTVRYAMQARNIQTNPVIQLDPQEEMVNNFKMEITYLKKENAKLKSLLEKEPKYHDIIKKIEIETDEYHKKLKSRPGSPVSKLSKGIISYRDRVNSSIPSLPEIKARARGASSHSRKSTVANNNSTFRTSVPAKKALINALPQRLSDQRKLPKSAAKQRIEELKRSDAPARHESDKSIKQQSNIQSSKNEGRETPHPNKKLMKRPSAVEQMPQIIQSDAFPQPKDVKRDIQILDQEISRMKKPKTSDSSHFKKEMHSTKGQKPKTKEEPLAQSQHKKNEVKANSSSQGRSKKKSEVAMENTATSLKKRK